MKILFDDDMKGNEEKSLISITVTPGNNSVPKGITLQYSATGSFSDGSMSDVSDQASWESSDTNVAMIDNSRSSEGYITAQNTGSATISATFDTVTGNAELTVTDEELVS